jgi:hypothetical protein
MPDEFQVSVFYVSGRVDLQPTPAAQNATGKSTSDGQSATPAVDEKKRRIELERSVARDLNKQSQEIAASIESEMRRMLVAHAGITVQAEVAFRRGSLLLEGSVVLLSWAGSLVLEALRAEIGEVIKVAFRRAISNVLNAMPALATADVGAMDMTVTEMRRPRVSQPSTRAGLGLLRSDVVPIWIPFLLLLLTVLVLVLIADRFFVISTRTPISPPPQSQTATPSPITPRGGP